jgi:hypothetical protein
MELVPTLPLPGGFELHHDQMTLLFLLAEPIVDVGTDGDFAVRQAAAKPRARGIEAAVGKRTNPARRRLRTKGGQRAKDGQRQKGKNG